MALGSAPDRVVHKILEKAMAKAERRLPHPHGGGGLPVLGSLAQLRIGIALVERGLAWFPPAPGTDQGVLDRVRAVAAGDTSLSHEAMRQLKPWRGGVAGQLAGFAIKAATNYRFSPASARNSIGTHVENAAAALAVAMRASDGDAGVDRALVEIDTAIMVRELVDELEERALAPSSPIAGVIARPKGVMLARLADGTFGVFVKLRGRYAWHEGTLDAMFAMVPDEHLELVGDCVARAGLR